MSRLMISSILLKTRNRLLPSSSSSLNSYRCSNQFIRHLLTSKDNNEIKIKIDSNNVQITNDSSSSNSTNDISSISSNNSINSSNITQISNDSNNNNEMIDVPGVKTAGDKLIIVYTCKVCDTRSAKKISKQGYNKGVVLVRCGKCQNLHLIADHLGVFEDKGWDIQKYLAQSGENVNVVTDDNVLELTPKEILGK
jgi:protein import protein ZIM17